MSGCVAGRFARFVDNHPGMTEELPLVHSTRCEKFLEIAKTRSLAPQPCPVFNEPLLYLFYGRPAYRSKVGTKPSTDIAYCPVCFVFKPYTISAEVIRVFPFDSGASKGGLFEPQVARADTDNFQLSTTLESARRAASLFFDTNQNFFIGEPRRGLIIPPTEEEALRYYGLISHDGEDDYDDRRSAIEVQASTAISLRDILLAVILPLSFLQDADVKKVVVQEWRTYPITYSTVRGTIPRDYARDVSVKLESFLKEGQYL
jgi:hypothetical protein